MTLALSMLSGCLVDDPPPFSPPQQTPPRLDYTKALPGLDQIIPANQGDVITFKMPVTSEDAGDDLSALLLFDYDGNPLRGAETLSSGRLPASTLADTNQRVFSLPWLVRGNIDPGCHRITLRVTHDANTGSPTTVVFDKKDLAEAYWFANINVTPENANALVNCPQGSTASDAP